MPVTGATTRNDYVASSGQTVFSYTFQILLDSDIKVIKNGTTLALSSNYTVSGAGVAGGGNVTLTDGAEANDSIGILLAMPIDRTTEYQNAGDFLASDVNGDFDKGYIAMNQLQTDIRRSMHLKDQDPNINMELPVKAERASKFLAFDANGQPIVYTAGIGAAATYQPSFTNSVSRSLQSRLEDYASVADFGAVGDGLTDDTAALQHAFLYGNATRTKIVMEGKTYLYSDLLATITNSVEIEGAGDGTILLKDDSYTGPAFEINNTFGQIGHFYPNSAGDQNQVADLTRMKSPSFKGFSIVGKSRIYAGGGFELKDRNDMLKIQDVNCFNLKGSAFKFTGTFGNLRESNISRFVVRMCGDENNPAVDLKMPSFSNTQATIATVGTKSRVTLSGTGEDFSSLSIGNMKIRVLGSRYDGFTQEWKITSIISDTVVELEYDITTEINPNTGNPWGQNVTNAACVFYRDVDGLNHISFDDCQIVGCYGTYLNVEHDRVNFFRRVVFNNLMVHGSNKKYFDDEQQGPSGDLILITGGIGSVDFRGLRLNTNEVDKGVTPNIKYAGVRIREGQVISQDIPDRVWINDLDMLNLNNDGEAMFVVENVKNLSVNGTVAASQNSGTELKVLAGSVFEAIDYNVISGTSKNVRNNGVLPAFDIATDVSNKVFITENQRRDTNVSTNQFKDITSDINTTEGLGTTLFSSVKRANVVKNAPTASGTIEGAEWNLVDGKVAYIPGRQIGGTVAGTWTASSTSGEYYLDTGSAFTDVVQVVEDDYMILNNGTLGSLGNGEWAVGDNDSLGNDTLYVKPLAPVSPASLDDYDLRYRKAVDGTTTRATRREFYGNPLPSTGYYYNGDRFYDITPSAVTGDAFAYVCRVRGFGDSAQGGTATWEPYGVIDG